jgi:small subunit ribosomal protein S16
LNIGVIKKEKQMSVKIRMSRMGRRHRPFFRINVIDSRTPRDGRIIEKLGHYDPLEKSSEKEIVIDLERVKYWLDKGAIPSDAVSEILLRKGIKHKYAADRKTKRALARKRVRAAGLPFLKSERKTKEKPAEGAAPAAAAPGSTPSTNSGQASSPQGAPAAEKPKEEKK